MTPRRAHCQMWLVLLGIASCYQKHEAPRAFEKATDPSHVIVREEPRRTHVKLGDVDAQTSLDQLSGLSPAKPARIQTEPGLKVALFGDQGMRATSRAVLKMIAREKADMIVHLGDLAYDAAPPAVWEQQVDAVLGPDFPYFAVIGNHDVPSWFVKDGFAQRLGARLSRMQSHGAHCQGEYAINASCTFRGLHFVLSGVGTYGHDHEQFLRSALETSNAQHNLCLWHKNQRDMQVGGKIDEVGWEAYQICATHGAPIITGHEHSYSRTYALQAVGDRKQKHGSTGLASDMVLGPGRTFVVVSGLGGESTRIFTPEHKNDSWWASIYAGNYQVMNGETRGTKPNIDFGVLFITYGVDGDSTRASAYFKTIGNPEAIADEFSWRTEPEPVAR